MALIIDPVSLKTVGYLKTVGEGYYMFIETQESKQMVRGKRDKEKEANRKKMRKGEKNK